MGPCGGWGPRGPYSDRGRSLEHLVTAAPFKIFWKLNFENLILGLHQAMEV